MKERQLLFITVIGEDKKGIVAKISDYLFKTDINIEDINQRIMGDGYFVMTMLVDIGDSKESMGEIATAVEKIGKDLSVRIQLQHENIFKMMHRI
ncbi:MAG: ACT domain-containing protein [Deltaproteobacteria bacterium]|nr:ACT domain-containing protein [Deltaproteobacteria bacterium]